MAAREYTTLSVRETTLEKIKATKPYESLSHDEWLIEVLDRFDEGDTPNA
jgi:hypothetical protein